MVIADLNGREGFVNKETLVGRYGSRFRGFSWTTRWIERARGLFQNVPSIHAGYLAAIFEGAGIYLLRALFRLLNCRNAGRQFLDQSAMLYLAEVAYRGYRYEFANDSATLRDVCRMVELERQYCGFLNFDLTENAKAIRLDVSGQPEARAIVEDLFG